VLLFRVLGAADRRRRGAGAAVGSILLLAVIAPVRLAALPSASFRLSDARLVRKRVLSCVSAGAAVAGERPLAEIVNGFAGNRFDVHPTVSQIPELSELLEGRDPVFFLSHSERMRNALQRSFDLEPIVSFGGRRYQLPVGLRGLRVDRLRRRPGVHGRTARANAPMRPLQGRAARRSDPDGSLSPHPTRICRECFPPSSATALSERCSVRWAGEA